MDALPIRAAPLVRAAPAASRPPKAAAAHPAAARPASHDATPEDLALLAQQAAFDRAMQLRAELQREANALRDMAMEQVKHDDAAMNAWIKLI